MAMVIVHVRRVDLTSLRASNLLGLVAGPTIGRRARITELADPSDHLAHMAVGVLAIWALANRDS